MNTLLLFFQRYQRSMLANLLCALRLTVTVVLLLCTAQMSYGKSGSDYKTVEWVDLIPKADLDILLNPPESITSVPHNADLGANSLDMLTDSIDQAIGQAQKERVPTPEEQLYSAALESTNVKSEFNNTKIRLPGFVVPLEYNDDQVITEFFLVPYFGACIHVPPPPPNQIIHVKYPQGLTLSALYDPFWIEGTMKTELVQNSLATSAYALDASNIAPYEPYNQ